jgi:hydrogenase maturation protease
MPSDSLSHADCKPLLVFACGNPSRGDDALGPEFIQRLSQALASTTLATRVECLTDFQLQIEHATDLHGRERVLFVDACVASCEVSLQPVRAVTTPGYTTHAMTPAAVLAVYSQVYATAPPTSVQLALRGHEFELGSGLSEQAGKNL